MSSQPCSRFAAELDGAALLPVNACCCGARTHPHGSPRSLVHVARSGSDAAGRDRVQPALLRGLPLKCSLPLSWAMQHCCFRVEVLGVHLRWRHAAAGSRKLLERARLCAGAGLRHLERANRELGPDQQMRRLFRWPEPQLPYTSTGKLLRRQVGNWACAQAGGSYPLSAGDEQDALLRLISQVQVKLRSTPRRRQPFDRRSSPRQPVEGATAVCIGATVRGGTRG